MTETNVRPLWPEDRAETVYTFISNWLESVGSGRKRRRLSDSHLYRPDSHPRDGPVHRGDYPPWKRLLRSVRPTRSMSAMDYTRDVAGFAVPSHPASRSPSRRSRRPSTVATQIDGSAPSTPSQVTGGPRGRGYRKENLQFNSIYVKLPDTPLPGFVASHVEKVLRADRAEPSSDDMKLLVRQLNVLSAGCDEAAVADVFKGKIFPDANALCAYGTAGLAKSSGLLMYQHLVPVNPVSPYKVTQSKPSMLYGYSGDQDVAFTQQQLLAQTVIHPQNPHYLVATSDCLSFPFLVVEFKAAGGTRGDLWVAANQCAGAASCCLNATLQLNSVLPPQAQQSLIDNIAYCIALDNNTAQLFVSWTDGFLRYYVQRVSAFLVSDPDHLADLRKQVRNILDWGQGTRLQQVRNALDAILIARQQPP